MTKSAIQLATILAVLLPTFELHAQLVTTFRLARHAGVPDLNNNEINGMFDRATVALTDAILPDDVACDMRLHRLDVGKWWYSANNINSTVASQTDYVNHQANTAHAYALIVNVLNWCLIPGSFGGCGWPTGSHKPFIITYNLANDAAGQRGIVMAHEFGHTVGLNHDTTSHTQQIMFGGALRSEYHKVWSSSSCHNYETIFSDTCPSPDTNPAWLTWPCLQTLDNGAFPTAMSSSSTVLETTQAGAVASTAATANDQDYSNIPIEDVAHSFIVDSMPVEVEDYYGPNDLAKLRSMLLDSTNRPFYRTIATLIGLISQGDKADVQALLNYANQPGADLSSAFFGLGYIVARTRNQAALDLLLRFEQSSDPAVIQSASLGLSVTGHPTGLTRLQNRARQARGEQVEAANSAVRYNQQVAQMGLRRFYRQSVVAQTVTPHLVNPQAGFEP